MEEEERSSLLTRSLQDYRQDRSGAERGEGRGEEGSREERRGTEREGRAGQGRAGHRRGEERSMKRARSDQGLLSYALTSIGEERRGQA
eukprot:455293-Hanusia_phi.AAC.1